MASQAPLLQAASVGRWATGDPAVGDCDSCCSQIVLLAGAGLLSEAGLFTESLLGSPFSVS